MKPLLLKLHSFLRNISQGMANQKRYNNTKLWLRVFSRTILLLQPSYYPVCFDEIKCQKKIEFFSSSFKNRLNAIGLILFLSPPPVPSFSPLCFVNIRQKCRRKNSRVSKKGYSIWSRSSALEKFFDTQRRRWFILWNKFW